MSRIYDALQRADLERRGAQPTGPAGSPDAFFPADMEEPSTAQAAFMEEKIVRYAWDPSLLSLPTLGERGESIEQFRGLRSHLYQLREQAPLRTILVCSGEPGEGKSFVAANLAISLARNSSSSVLLIDADLRRPMQHRSFGTPIVPGLTEYLAGTAEVNDILQRNRDARRAEGEQSQAPPDLTFLPAGRGGDNSSELIASHRFEELIAILAPHFDWIIIDSPPIMAFSDAVDLARAADGVLLVARAATTSYLVAQRAQTAFSNSRVLGFVLNAARNVPNTGYYYYYAARETESNAAKGNKKRK